MGFGSGAGSSSTVGADGWGLGVLEGMGSSNVARLRSFSIRLGESLERSSLRSSSICSGDMAATRAALSSLMRCLSVRLSSWGACVAA